MHLRTHKKTYPTIVQVNIPGAGTANVQCTNSTSMQKSLLWLDTYLVPAQTDFIIFLSTQRSKCNILCAYAQMQTLRSYVEQIILPIVHNARVLRTYVDS